MSFKFTLATGIESKGSYATYIFSLIYLKTYIFNLKAESHVRIAYKNLHKLGFLD